MPGPVTEDAFAKVNLTLRILGRRADGYHELRSLVAFAQTGDRVTAARAEGISLDVTGPFAPALEAEAGNLVLRAGRALRELAGVTAGAHLTLEKNLPVASGIGGGSADAAAALRALMRLWKIEPDETSLAALAASLGADVPVCLASSSALMWGIGERIGRLPLPAFWLVLANPGIALSTPAVFRELAAPPLDALPSDPALPAFATLERLVRWAAEEGNDLEAPAIALAPIVGEVRDAIAATADCLLARMSGSGATCFGLYPSEAAAGEAVCALAAAHPGWWIAAGRAL
ncbi:MAG: 4-(cytidine 5'-diphospho)-2-C-methyl-D-erythritol kinase [Alphaproteobacteria bacterium HGW-Alphaproteobacteria-3]|nr:MAG: 4-(cytidine 5'-diphospho)-2-C-methyl-D-erythritol kinase [Alphaproteobacteria bacterium HGW-Alphaproteobacteria-3]